VALAWIITTAGAVNVLSLAGVAIWTLGGRFGLNDCDQTGLLRCNREDVSEANVRIFSPLE
jgi:hypothetical protein